MDETLKQIENFHGHLGPFVVLGYRMGLIANKKFGNNPFEKKAIVYTGTTPPISCIVDGIQMSSGCTLGKGNIKTIDKSEAKAEFFSNENPKNKVTISLNPELKKEIDTQINEENMVSYSEMLWKKSDNELFLIL